MDDVMRLATKNKLEVIVLGDLNCDINTSWGQTVGCWNLPWPMILNKWTNARDLENKHPHWCVNNQHPVCLRRQA